MPATMALFSGQHSFYNLDATGNQIPCTKCHGDVKAELSGTGFDPISGTSAPHASFRCEYCHRAENGFASGSDSYAKITYTNVTPGEANIYLVTTVLNFENGNFPKSIDYATGMTVDNWAGKIFDMYGSAFMDQVQFRDELTGNYSGSLSTNGEIAEYEYTYASEVPLYDNGTPKDTNTSTQYTAFDPRAVTWDGSIENLTGAGSLEVTPGTRYHAASLVSCLECHGGDLSKGAPGYQMNTSEPYNHASWSVENTTTDCQTCHYGNIPGTPQFETEFEAGGFGLTTYAKDTGEVEAHNSLVKTNESMSVFGYGASNDACIACHVHVAVEISYNKSYLLRFNAIESPEGTYKVQNFSSDGTVNVIVYGNASGSTFAVSNSSYGWTPDTDLYINGTGPLVFGLNNDQTENMNALIGQ